MLVFALCSLAWIFPLFPLCFSFGPSSTLSMLSSRLGAHGLLGNLSISGTATRDFEKGVVMQMQLPVFNTTNEIQSPLSCPGEMSGCCLCEDLVLSSLVTQVIFVQDIRQTRVGPDSMTVLS